jgi:long-chain acyl-CoA synthetase
VPATDVKTTLPHLLRRNAQTFGRHRVALREKQFGLWQKFTWADYQDKVTELALGLMDLGLGPDAKLAVIGDNRPEWLFSELAAQALGAVPVGVYQDSILTEVKFIINHSDARIVIAEDQEQVDKILDMKDELPRIERVIYTDPKGLWDYDSPLLMDLEEVYDRGRRVLESDPQAYDGLLERLSPEGLALICYTSGTTGEPKGSMLTHRGVLSMAAYLNEADPRTPNDQYLSFVPLPWIVEQMMAVYSALEVGYTVNFPEEPETAMADLYEIGPELVVAAPRVWEALSRQVMVKHLDASWFKRIMYELCLPIGYRWADFKFAKRRPPLTWKVLYGLAYTALFRALRDRLGFSNVKSAITGGAALGPDVFRFFHALGVNLKQIYGQTEISGYSTIHRTGDINFDSVGPPVPGCEVQITADGEIVSRGPGLFLGYYKNDQATAETIKDGWLHSGDAGYFTEAGHLICIDRVKDLMVLASGEKFSPMFIENKLKFCPYVVESVVLGHERSFVTAMICIDYKHTGKWAEDRRISYTTYTDLASKEEVYDLIEDEVFRVNSSLPAPARIQRFLLLYKELDPDDEELTRTKKLRRNFINQKYEREIDALYTEAGFVPIESVIRYQDGRTATLKTDLQIRTMRDDAYYAGRRTKRRWRRRGK